MVRAEKRKSDRDVHDLGFVFQHSYYRWFQVDRDPKLEEIVIEAGKTLYRDVWFDKPPLTPMLYWVLGAQPGLVLRLAGALYALLACWIAWKFGRDLWTESEGLWAAVYSGVPPLDAGSRRTVSALSIDGAGP